MQIFSLHFYGIKFSDRQIFLPVNETITGTTNPSRVDLGVIAIKKKENSSQSFRTGASKLDAVLCHTLDTSF